MNCFRIILGGCLSASAAGALAGTFTDAFSSGLNPAYWSVNQTTAGRYTVDTSGGDLHLFKGVSGGSGSIQNVAVQLNMAAIGGPVTGDFSSQVSFSNAVLSTSGITQVELHTQFSDSSFFFDVYDNSAGKNFHVWNGGLHGTTGTSLTGASMSIQRVGSSLSGYYNGNLIFSTASNPTAALNSMYLVFQTQPGEGGSAQSVNFSDFSLTGSSVVPEPVSMLSLGVTAAALLAKKRRK